MEDVYEPAEDSFMLAEYARRCRGAILEIGCGTGIVSLSAAAADKNNRVVGIDANSIAVKNANLNKKFNKITNATFLKSSLFSKVPKEKFDFILFNPPYLPTSKGEKLADKINLAFDGGKSGNEVIIQFLSQAPRFLSRNGKIAIILSSMNNIEHILKACGGFGLTGKPIASESFFFEKICLCELQQSE